MTRAPSATTFDAPRWKERHMRVSAEEEAAMETSDRPVLNVWCNADARGHRTLVIAGPTQRAVLPWNSSSLPDDLVVVVHEVADEFRGRLDLVDALRAQIAVLEARVANVDRNISVVTEGYALERDAAIAVAERDSLCAHHAARIAEIARCVREERYGCGAHPAGDPAEVSRLIEATDAALARTP